MNDVREALNSVFQQVFEDASLQISDEMTAKDVAEWDSLNHINLIVAVEKKFKISFTTKEISALRNVGDFLALIRKKIT